MDSAIGSALGFLFWIIITRLYNTSDIGLAVALISASGLVTNISKLGLDNSIVRFLANENDKKSFINTCLTVVSITSIIVSMIFLLGINIWAQKLIFVKDSIYYMLIVFLFNVTAVSLLITSHIFISLRNTKYYLLQNLVFQSLKVALPFFFILFATFGIFISWYISMTIALLISILFLIRSLVPSYVPYPTINKKIINKIFHFSTGNYLISVFGGASNSILPLMILHFLKPEDSAYYYIVFTIVGLLFIIPSAYSTSLFAEGSFNEKTFVSNLKKALKQTYLLLVPCVILIIIFGDNLLMLFGNDYSSSGQLLLSILAISSFFMPLNSFYNTYLRVRLKISELLIIAIMNVLLLLGISYILLPTIGLIGIGFAYIASAVVVSGYVILRISSRKLTIKFFF